jgi:ribosomal protein S1
MNSVIIPNLKVGDKVEVYVESQEDKKGQLLLSHKKHVQCVHGTGLMPHLKKMK